jgi:deoxyribodipyrimidine photo-lyase
MMSPASRKSKVSTPTQGPSTSGCARPTEQPELRMIHRERIVELNDLPIRPGGDYVLYWMQSAQRTRYNHALEFAIRRANHLNRPVLVFFGISENYPSANARHYHFMLDGLREVRDELAELGIPAAILRVAPHVGATLLAADACLLVTDDGHLPYLREWRTNVAHSIPCRAYEVTTNLIVPVQSASQKEEYSAATFRPRVTEQLSYFHKPLRHSVPRVSFSPGIKSVDISDVSSTVRLLAVDFSVKPTGFYRGGTSSALILLKEFVTGKLAHYSAWSNDPTRNALSDMSPYLHFGQISPLEIAMTVSKAGKSSSAADYLEQLIVRRELSHNFVRYNRLAGSYDGLPPWARRTLDFHARDDRDYLYSLRDFENAATHDPYWNAAQQQMVVTGKMHGYMRMYWCKKILEWTSSPAEAFQLALCLNDRYELDGRDANGITGVAWCFGKHDRPWRERPVFGQVRYMNAAGLRRRFDPDLYVEHITALAAAGRPT